ncbi:hypothetical protein [Microbacterium aoyamense]|nr:hypothetical protein [Microbacterium aoyamense]
MAPGRVDFTLRDESPRHVVELCRPLVQGQGFGTIVVTPTRLPMRDVGTAAILANARFSGRLTGRERRTRVSGDGIVGQLGTDNNQGTVIAPLSTPTTFATWATALLPTYLNAGITPAAGGGSYTKDFKAVTVRAALDEVCAFFGGEWRVRPNFTLDVGTRAQLFVTTPKTVVVSRRGEGSRELHLTGLVGDLSLSEDLEDWERSRMLYYGSGTTSVEQGGLTVAAADVPFREPDGTSAEIRRITEDSQITASADALGLATAEWGKVRYGHREFRASVDAYDVGMHVGVGDSVWVYAPEQGVFNIANQVRYRGGVIFPESIRCVGRTWPIREGMGIYFRRWVNNGTTTWGEDWVDLSPYVLPETGDATLELFAVPRKLKVA